MVAKKQKKSIPSRVKDIADVITAVGIIGAAAVSIGTWCVTRINAETNAKIDEVSNKIDSIELNSTRNQLLTLLSDYPNNEDEILKVAKYYFKDLNGDWYMTTLFTKWAEDRGLNVDTIVNISGGK